VKELIELVVEDVDQDEALKLAYDLNPSWPELHKIFMAIAGDSDNENLMAYKGILTCLIFNSFRIRPGRGLEILEALPRDCNDLMGPVFAPAKRRIAGLLAERMQATEGGTICFG
jgi:hypothetical protein